MSVTTSSGELQVVHLLKTNTCLISYVQQTTETISDSLRYVSNIAGPLSVTPHETLYSHIITEYSVVCRGVDTYRARCSGEGTDCPASYGTKRATTQKTRRPDRAVSTTQNSLSRSVLDRSRCVEPRCVLNIAPIKSVGRPVARLTWWRDNCPELSSRDRRRRRYYNASGTPSLPPLLFHRHHTASLAFSPSPSF